MLNSENKICQNCHNSFVIDEQDFKFYEKISVPPPSFCPECRLQRRLAFRNERTLYKRKCDLCGKETITMYGPHTLIKNYCSPCWWSDNWEPLGYGKNYDFSKPFFLQFRELMENVPHQNLSVSYKTLINSEYNNMNHYLKNCYWLFNSDYDEDCLYGEEIEHSKDCVDITMINQSQLIFHSVNCQKCYQVFYSQDCENCRDVWFSKNLIGCSDCFGCVNLRNKQHHIFNIPYSKAQYFEKLENFNLTSAKSIEDFKNHAQGFYLKFPQKFMHGRQNSNVSGDYIYHSKNVSNSYILTESENCKHCMWLINKPNKDCYDYTQFGENTQNVYEALVCGKGINNVLNSMFVLEGRLIQYSAHCLNNCSNLFGCIGLRAKKYCILNKQYAQEEYKALLPKIIQHMEKMPYLDNKDRIYRYGEFFPCNISPFAYNETTAQEYFPLTKEQALAQGYSWRDPEERNYQLTMRTEDIPDHIKDVKDSIIDEVIECANYPIYSEPAANNNGSETNLGTKFPIGNLVPKLKPEFSNCTTAFRIIKPELEFLRKMNLPLPRLCPNCRHYQRIRQRNPLKLWHRQCMCAGKSSTNDLQPTTNNIYQNTALHFHQDKPCPNEFETSYSPERQEIVYCEQCYLSEVV